MPSLADVCDSSLIVHYKDTAWHQSSYFIEGPENRAFEWGGLLLVMRLYSINSERAVFVGPLWPECTMSLWGSDHRTLSLRSLRVDRYWSFDSEPQTHKCAPAHAYMHADRQAYTITRAYAWSHAHAKVLTNWLTVLSRNLTHPIFSAWSADGWK
jgi:hypothetical protein